MQAPARYLVHMLPDQPHRSCLAERAVRAAGGCFDSDPLAAGRTSTQRDLEFGTQDFVGAIDDLRIWRTVRSQAQLQQVDLRNPRADVTSLSPALAPRGWVRVERPAKSRSKCKMCLLAGAFEVGRAAQSRLWNGLSLQAWPGGALHLPTILL